MTALVSLHPLPGPGAAAMASAADSFASAVPVTAGRGYRSARDRLRRVLEALALPEVSIAMAVSDYSRFYRALPQESEIRISVEPDGVWLRLRLEVEVPAVLGSAMAAVMSHFRLEPQQPAQAERTRLVFGRVYPRGAEADVARARQLLSQETAEELALKAQEAKQILSQTQSRLSSVQEDLKIASEIQLRMLLSREKLRQIHPGLDCYAYMIPCRDIGGDLFDVISLDSDHVAVIVGDVSGKGLSAALTMATCITLLRAYSESFRAPSRIMRKINPRLIDGNESDCLFTTLFLGIINLQKDSLTYCNAGHNPVVLQRADGQIEELSDVHGPAVGVFDNVPYEQSRVSFMPGDRLLLYTDGASETFSQAGDLYGAERLLAYCRRSADVQSMRKLLSGLLLDINLFGGTELSHDDVTLVAIRRDPLVHEEVFSSEHEAQADVEGMASLMAASDGFCEARGILPEISGRLQLVLDELLVNVVDHGAAGSDRIPAIRLLMRHFPASELLVVEIRDDGIPFNPFALAEPDTDLTIEERELGGLGIFLVRALARSFSYSFEQPWNQVLLEISTRPEVIA